MTVRKFLKILIFITERVKEKHKGLYSLALLIAQPLDKEFILFCCDLDKIAIRNIKKKSSYLTKIIFLN
jgi:hypothetical protein